MNPHKKKQVLKDEENHAMRKINIDTTGSTAITTQKQKKPKKTLPITTNPNPLVDRLLLPNRHSSQIALVLVSPLNLTLLSEPSLLVSDSQRIASNNLLGSVDLLSRQTVLISRDPDDRDLGDDSRVNVCFVVLLLRVRADG